MSLSVTRLTLTSFRSYETLRLDVDALPVVVTGPNGVGKTNLLEALSFLTPGRGLRQARLIDIQKLGSPVEAPWAVAASLQNSQGRVDVATGRDTQSSSTLERRLVFIDGQQVRQQQALAEHVRMVWLTPAMDRLFLEGASERRRFLDRLVFNYDPAHAGRISRYEKALRERGRLLREYPHPDESWLRALEEDLAATGIAIAAARSDLIRRLETVIADANDTLFPRPRMYIEGLVDKSLETLSALHAEDQLRDLLVHARRPSEHEEEMTTPGPHRSDFRVHHAAKDRPAEMCSTGEQKALLISILLAHAQLMKETWGKPPILLLDEVAAHLDVRRREALLNILLGLKTQVWMTGTDRDDFQILTKKAHYISLGDI